MEQLNVSVDSYDTMVPITVTLDGSSFTKFNKYLIGDILGKYQLGISDWFIHHRIRYFESQGRLEAVDKASDSEPGYRRHLRKTTK